MVYDLKRAASKLALILFLKSNQHIEFNNHVA